MRRILGLICVISLMTSMMAYAKVDETEAIETTKIDEIERTIQQINDIRTNHLNLEPITSDQKLKEMSLNHAKYMGYNNILSTIEESNLDYFRGRFPWDRASYYKYDQDFVYEFVQKGVVNYYEVFKKLMYDPVSRNVLFNPMYTEIGMGVSEQYISYNLGGNDFKENRYITYPYDEQKNVPIKWQGDAYNQLLDYLSPETKEIGLPITVAHYGVVTNSLNNINVTFINMTTGETVPYELIMPNQFHQLKNVLTVVPKKPYNYGTTYAVSISFTAIFKDGTSFDYHKVFTFETESLGVSQVEKKYLTRGLFTEKVIKNSGYSLIEPLEYRFTDVNIKTPGSMYIYTASQIGLINGFGDNLFRPELNITIEQALKIIVLDFEKNRNEIIVPNQDALKEFVDQDFISNWAYDYMLKANELGLITQKTDLKDYLTVDGFDAILILYNKNIKSLSKQ